MGCGCGGPDIVPPHNESCYNPQGLTNGSVAHNTQRLIDYGAHVQGGGLGAYSWCYLPKDYHQYLRIGFMCNGTLINLDKNDDIGLQPGYAGVLGGRPNPCNSEEISKIIANCCELGGGNIGSAGVPGLDNWYYPITGEPNSYSYTMGSYAIGPGMYHGGYKILPERGIIVFDPCVPMDYIIMEYTGDILNDSGNCLVPPSVEDNMILQLWVPYIEKVFDDKANENAINAAYRRWYQAVIDCNSNIQAFNKHEWIKLIRSYCYAGTKA